MHRNFIQLLEVNISLEFLCSGADQSADAHVVLIGLLGNNTPAMFEINLLNYCAWSSEYDRVLSLLSSDVSVLGGILVRIALR